MRRFNPDRELYKIQHGNRNKILYGVIALLIIAIGSSYALYQIRYNKTIIYTKVAPFTKKDIILSVKLDDQNNSTDMFPTKEEGYVYSHIECENNNIINANWNEDTWNLNAEINGPDQCTVFFSKSPFKMKSCEDKSISECLLEEGQKFTSILAFDDPDSNARYYGKDPANYIWFNCDDYSKTSAETCERWRIIGSFKDIEKVNEDGSTTKQNLVKILRHNIIGIIPYNNKENGDNIWANASLQENLNNEYLTNGDDGSWIITQKNIEVNGYGNTERSNDYKAINDNTVNLIEKVVWKIGEYSNLKQETASDLYNAERNVLDSQINFIWKGKVAIISGSDFAYSIGGEQRKTCLNSIQYSGKGYPDACATIQWLLPGGWRRLINTTAGDTKNTVTYGMKGLSGSAVTSGTQLQPTLYLKHDVKISSGDGTYENPYVLVP